jgi:hypothetical protein
MRVGSIKVFVNDRYSSDPGHRMRRTVPTPAHLE